MIGVRRARALLAAAAVAAGLGLAAPSGVHADLGTGCQGTYALASGQTAECSFVYSGPDSAGFFTDGAGGYVNGGPTLVQFRLQASETQVLDHCEAVSLSFSGCGSGSSGDTAPVTPGTVVFCIVDNIGPQAASGGFDCDSGT